LTDDFANFELWGLVFSDIIYFVFQVIEPKPEIKKPTSDKKKKQFIFFFGSDN